MAGNPFLAALDLADQALSAQDLGAAISAFDDADTHRPKRCSDIELRRIFAVSNRALGLIQTQVLAGADGIEIRLMWRLETMLERTFVDIDGDNRDHVQSSVTRNTAFGRVAEEYEPTQPLPLPHIPLTFAEAQALAAPYLRFLEQKILVNPMAHLPLAWKAFKQPAPPFEAVFEAWLEDIDQRGLTKAPSLTSLRRAMALETLAYEGRQRVSWKDCTTLLLPQLLDPHPMVAGCAAKYLGVLYDDPDEMFVWDKPEPITWILDHLAALPVNRCAAAGGFLDGFDVGMDGPFHTLKKLDALADYDLDDWVLKVLALKEVEAYYPGAQAFWFPVHEHYCQDIPFITRLLDAGHEWVAYMCATEVPGGVDGMEVILDRLAKSETFAKLRQ